MSTLPGQASKGEKTKSKFQSLDINSLYRHSRGENLEKTQQKSSLTYVKHGMQSLGKVPNARRAPANLPSLKSEHSGTDAAVPLVPPGASGWGKQEGTTTITSSPPTATITTANAPTQQQQQQPNAQLTSHQAAIALPVTTTIPSQPKHPAPSAPSAITDKLWSSVMSGGQDPLHPPPYQSPQFQHEFPSLSAGDGAPTRTGSDAQYPSGLSLRPQTEGSWSQGGTRPGVDGPPRTGSGPLGAPPQLLAQAGQQQPLPSQFRGVLPPFMYKGNFQPSNIGIPNSNQQTPVNGRGRPESRPPRLADADEISPRPIIREEDLIRMDEIGTDMGWAAQDDIDYNQKLAFSDDESDNKKPNRDNKSHQHQHKEKDRGESHPNDIQNRNWGRSTSSRGRSSEEDELWMQQARKHAEKNIEEAIQRAIHRKEQEEKRFNETTKQGAQKKLQELEEKISKRNIDHQDCTINININPVSSLPIKTINHVDIPLPEFQKEKERERDSRSRTPNEIIDDKSSPTSRDNSFRQLTQIEGKNFPRKHAKVDREARDNREQRDIREPNGPSFSRHFQSDLPPRFLKHQRNNSNSNLQSQPSQHYQFENRWMSNNQNIKQTSNRNVKQDSPERELEDERRDYKRQSSEDSYRSSHHSQSELPQKTQESNRHPDEYKRRENRDKEEDKWHREKDRTEKRQDYPAERQPEDWHDRRDKVREEKTQERYERPQRPDSRDSRSTRHSRDSEPRDYIGSWSESSYEPSYDDKRRDYPREDRRQVPGPITKERIEADDMRSEKRNLTQLKRGQVEKKLIDSKKDDKSQDSLGDEKKIKDIDLDLGNSTGAWADSIPTALDQPELSQDKCNKSNSNLEMHKIEMKHFGGEIRKGDKVEEFKDRRNRMYGPNKNWSASSNEYHRSAAWSKRPAIRGHKSGGGGGRPPISGDFHGTDSEGSLEDHMERSPKPVKKIDKDDKNRDNKQEKLKTEKRDNYVPRGEPSRHGRGGANFRGSRMSGMSKRIDGYGPPPSKSPFGHHEDKEKKISSDEATSEVSTEDKVKQNQQITSGVRKDGPQSQMDLFDDKNKHRKLDNRRGKSKTKIDGKREDEGDTNSENSDDKDGKSTRKPLIKQGPLRGMTSNNNLGRRNNPPPRLGGDKRNYDAPRSETLGSRQNSSGALAIKKDDKPNDQNILCSAIADISLKNRDESEAIDDKDDKIPFNGDSEGFQEVKSKKMVKKPADEKPLTKNIFKDKDPSKLDRSKKIGGNQLTQQQIQNIPSLMATPINPPVMLPLGKNQFERPRQNKLAPRFAKAKLKAQLQHHGICEVNDMNKVNQNINVYNMKDQSGAVGSVACAWDKPLGSQLRNMDHEGMLGVGVGIDGVKGLDQSQVVNQSTSPNHDKIMGKSNQLQDKTLLDGTTPPVNTIIFENTNFKSAPGARGVRTDKPRSKLDDSSIDTSVIGGFNKPMTELLNKSDNKSDTIQMPLSFKEDNADIKLDFFSSDLSHLTDEKSSKNLCMSKSIHAINSGNSAADLNFKIASVKKVWETPSEHNVGQDENNTSFSNSFVSDPNSLDPNNVFSKGNDTPDDNHEGYNSSPNQTASTSTNVCKVKPTQQVSGSGGQTVLSSSSHQQHSNIVAPGLMGNPLSPPPMQPVIGAGVGIGQPPQQYATNQHIGYQTGLGGSTQYGMSAIPSPPTVPTVLYNSTQQLQAQTAGLYGAFQIDQTAVLGGQGRSQYSQYPSHFGLGQTGSSPYSAQSVYLQATPQHPPPPTPQNPHELYTNMNSYRLPATAPFGQNQQLNNPNPTTVLISSTSNSLMSASVKPSSQQISAIGTKAGGVGQAYTQQTQPGQQVYMAYDPSIQANYLSSGVMQRGPTGPVQNNVVPGLQSSSYYSGSTGGQTGYFQQPGSSTLQSAPLQQHQAGYGLQGSVFGTHSQSNAGLQNYNSHFLSTPIQMALSAQQFRSGLPAGPYMKGVGSQQIGGDQNRPQQLKSPSSQEVLSSVFNTGSQIPSPKSKQTSKHPPPQSSPTAQHKYLYQQGAGHQTGNVQRYPTPIQRPVNFQHSLGVQQNNSANQKHRSNANNKAPNRQYYSSQNNALSSQSEKVDESKLNDSGVSLGNANTSGTTTNIGGKAALSTGGTSTVSVASDIVKEKQDTSTLKD